MQPRIKFLDSYQKDVDVFFAFVADAQFDGGQSLRWAVLDKFPQLQKYFDGNKFKGSKKDIEDFIQKEHLINDVQIKKSLEISSQKWQEVQKEFFTLIAQIFESRPWSNGKYIAFVTIWGMYPRFLEDKTFCIPYQGKMYSRTNEIIAHEMLHFMWYDYFLNKFPQHDNDDDIMLVWHTSEIFNTIVQNSGSWRKVFAHDVMGYPDHEKIITKLQKEYTEITKDNLDIFVQDILEQVKLELV